MPSNISKLATLTVTVVDQTDARIPGAHVSVTRPGANNKLQADSSLNGQVIFELEPGIYDLNVQSNGFSQWKENGLNFTGSMETQVTLIVCCVSDPIIVDDIYRGPPVESMVVSVQIPFEPLPQLSLTVIELQSRKRHWF
jgi:hypothetical protein